MFRTSSCPSSGATETAVAASGLPSELGDSSAVGRGRAGRPDHDQRHCYHHAPKVKPEVATAVVAPDDGHDDARNMLSCSRYTIQLMHYSHFKTQSRQHLKPIKC